jgi:lysozyme family protein
MRKTDEHHATRVTLAFDHFNPVQIIGGYVARYPDSYRFTLDYEGGYVNDPDDPGGCTNMGITIGTLRDWRGDQDVSCEDVQNLSPEEAGLIYATNYWAPVWGNQLPIGINTQVWDFGVNAGPSRAIKTLQLCVGSPQDGIMGPNTLAAVEDMPIEATLSRYHQERQRYYESLSTFSKYGNGWTNRNNDCYDLSVALHDQGPNPIPSLPDRPNGGGTDASTEARLARLELWAASFNTGE